MIQVNLKMEAPVISETLRRMGIGNERDRKIFPSCSLVKDSKGNYSIAHFKELLREPELNESDEKRLNTIVWLLNKWNLIEADVDGVINEKRIFILPVKRLIEERWSIVPKVHMVQGPAQSDGYELVF